MSYLEFLLLLFNIIFPFYISSKKETNYHHYLLAILSLILMGHLAFDGFRWQIIPIYLLSIILTFCLFKQWKFFSGGWVRKTISGLFLIFILGIGYGLATIFPVFELPVPTGQFQVGSQYLHLVSDQNEGITSDPNDKRELMIKVWYPADVQNEPTEKYLNDGDRFGFAQKYGLPNSTFQYLDKITTNTFSNASIANGKFPVLIFSHGYFSKASGYYALLEEIASHGFVVLNINHTYESVGTLFPAGELKFYAQEYNQKYNNETMAKLIWETMELYKNSSDEASKSQAVINVLKKYFAAEITHRWAQDIDLVVNEISNWNQSSFLAHHLDLAKIGVFGHSQGGAAAGEALLLNSEIKAGINLDGTQWGIMVDTFLSKPFLLLSSDWPEDHPDFNQYAFQNKGKADFYSAKIKDSGHSNFMDIPFMVNLPLLNEAGKINPLTAINISSEVVVAFFNKYLNQQKEDFSRVSDQHPELIMESQ